MRAYIKLHFWDFLLCWGMVAALSQSVNQCFYSTDGDSVNLAVTLLFSALILIVCFAGAFSKKSIILAVSLALTGFAALVVYLNISGVWRNGADLSAYVPMAIIFCISLPVFLLSRWKKGCVVLFLTGCYVFAGMAYLQYTERVIPYLLFLILCLVMFFVRSYWHNAVNHSTARVSFSKFGLTMAAMSMIIFFLGGAVVYGWIAKLNPPTVDIYLHEKLMALEVLERIGLTTNIPIYDDQRISDNSTDLARSSQNQGQEENKEKQETDNQKQGDEGNKAEETVKEQGSGAVKSQEQVKVITYFQSHLSRVMLAILLPIFLVLLIVLIKHYSRRSWYAKMKKMKSDEQITQLYLFFLKKLSRIGYKRDSSDTLFEYAGKMEGKLKLFVNGESNFQRLTEVYVRVNYGSKKVVEEDMQLYDNFYQCFYKNCRSSIGNFKYILKFLLL